MLDSNLEISSKSLGFGVWNFHVLRGHRGRRQSKEGMTTTGAQRVPHD
jgi:hypothetical protein